MTKKRTNTVILVIGARGVGKTDKIKNDIICSSKKRKKYLIDTADNDVWKSLKTHLRPANHAIKVPILPLEKLYMQPVGLHRILEGNPKKVFPELHRTTRNALLIIEDGTRYIKGTLSPAFLDILYDTKQRNNDLVIVFHALGSVPPDLVRGADKIVLFKTQESFNRNKYPFPNLEYWMEKIRAHESRFFCKTIPLS